MNFISWLLLNWNKLQANSKSLLRVSISSLTRFNRPCCLKINLGNSVSNYLMPLFHLLTSVKLNSDFQTSWCLKKVFCSAFTSCKDYAGFRLQWDSNCRNQHMSILAVFNCVVDLVAHFYGIDSCLYLFIYLFILHSMHAAINMAG
jgi:hypothetical protein